MMPISEPPIPPSTDITTTETTATLPDRPRHWYQQTAVAWIAAFFLLALAVACVLLAVWQFQAAESLRHANSKAMAAYLHRSTPSGGQGAPTVSLKNVEFCWTNQACALLEDLGGQLIPDDGSAVNVDKPTSYHVQVGGASVRMAPEQFAGMLNDSIFNYPNSALRNMSVAITEYKGQRHLKINGNIRVLLWVPFDMVTTLSVNKADNTLKMTVDDLDLFGFIPATWALKIRPFNLEKVLPLPSNNHLTVVKNTINIKPFGLFPPPRIGGTIESVAVEPQTIHLAFSGNRSGAGLQGNRMVVKGGTLQFGRLQMRPTELNISDQNQSDPFRFNLDTYQKRLGASNIDMQDSGAVAVTMPDMPKPKN